ncbi:alpha/beta hydrolase fold domain-containing protein [Streptomyces sp. NPDC059639]|uniref:alpha/beta hydrolase fold domain-containing protein n=1 Tax=Streptomyces sp. NPDC059639 TaxID=3346891 RepID=UPI0036C238CD
MVRLAFEGDWERAAAFPASASAHDRVELSPPTVVAGAGYDPTAPAAEAYAALPAQQGVPVQVLHFPTMFHPFLGFAPASPDAAGAFTATCMAAGRVAPHIGR